MKIDLNNTKVGADFELFIQNEKNEFISAIAFIEGTKNEPQLIGDKGHAIQHDGVLFEANVPPVGLFNPEDMWANIQYIIEEGQQRLPKELKITCCPNGEFAADQLDHPEAKEAGCTPDFNAWTQGDLNEKPLLEETAKRCCGFHLHLSWPGAKVEPAMRLIRILDVNLAIPMLFIDSDKERRNLYGKAGCFRFREYPNGMAGVEYRSLSNSVIESKEVFDFVWAQLVAAIRQFNVGTDFLPFSERIQSAINTYDTSAARQLAEELAINLMINEAA